jgi:hypothetical protein
MNTAHEANDRPLEDHELDLIVGAGATEAAGFGAVMLGAFGYLGPLGLAAAATYTVGSAIASKLK